MQLSYVGDKEGLLEYIAEQVNCWICMDTGEVGDMEQTFSGEPHMHTTSRSCVCQLREDFEE